MSQVASESLLWIKNELDATLVEARHVLESTAEQGGDLTLLHTCADHLHQVQGTLRMVEVYGAALLAEEMELVAKSLAEGKVDEKRRDEAFEVLMRAMVQLPDYLDRVLGGHRDLPIILLPLLNDLRTVRGEALLTEHALFARDIEEHAEALPESSEQRSGEDIREVARKRRSAYQGALVKWFKGTEPEAQLDKIAAIAEEFERAASAPKVFHFWWVVAGVIEALRDGGIESGVTLKQLLGQVDRQIKRLIDEGEDAITAEPPSELINNLLYFLAQATSQGPRVTRLREAFGLEGMLPAEELIESERESLAGPNVNLMKTVSSAIKEDLSRVKDTLDIFVRTGKGSADELAPLAELLKKVGDTLGVLGLGELRGEVDQERQLLAKMAEGEVAADESALMEMASALLRVEGELDEQVTRLVMGQQEAKPDEEARKDKSEFQLVSSAVLRECIVNLARVKEAIVEFVQTPDEKGVLDPLPSLIHQIQSGLDLLEMQRPIDLLDSISRYIRRRIQSAKSVPPQKELDRMADAIVSVEYYMETVQQGRGDPQYMLDNSESCVAALGFPIGGEESAEDAEPEPETEEPAPPAEPERDFEAISRDGEPTVVSPTQGFPEETRSDEDEETVVSEEAEPVGAPPAPPAEPEGPPPVIEGEADPELLEIFIEEAKEVIEAIQENLPRWQENPSDHDALVTVRRSFHTLKGSGRMVGAKFIGEFSWAFENMLNRVIDRTLDRTPDLLDLLTQSVEALPELVEQLEAGTTPSVDAETLRAGALHLARVASGEASGPPPTPTRDQAPAAEEEAPADEVTEESAPEATQEVTQDATEESPAEPAAAPATAETPTETPGPSMDPVLLDIFTKETRGHLETIKGFLADCEDTDAPWEVSADFYRAMHTLSGSAHMADVSAVFSLAAPLDKYSRRQLDRETGFTAEALSVIRRFVETVEAIVAALNQGRALPDTQDLAAAIAELPEAAEAAPPASTEGEEVTEYDDSAYEEIDIPPVADADEEDDARVPTEGEEVGYSETEEEIELSGGLEDEAPAPIEAEIEVEEPEEAEPAAAGIEVEEPEYEEPKFAGEATLAEEVDPELVAIFTEEAAEILEASDQTLQQVIKPGPERADALKELQRQIHTLKGGARMAALGHLGDLSHELETLMIEIVEGRVEVSEPISRLLQTSMDRLHQMLDRVQAGTAPEPAEDLIQAVKRAHRGGDPDAAGEAPPEAPVRTQEEEQPPPRVEAGDEDRPLETRREVTRVSTELLETLLNQAGEISIFRSRLEQQNSTVEFNVTELAQTVARLREQLRNMEMETEAQILATWQDELAARGEDDFDPLEMDRYSTIQQLSRALAESVNDLVSIQGTLNELAAESESLLLQQARVTTELQDGLMRTRMVPFRVYAQRLKRIVRQIANESEKRAELQLVGGEGELDRQVLERIMPPLEHMLRNAVIHGIERPADRRAKGKPESGTVTIRLHREGAEMVIEVFDDGAGLNVEGIRRKAIERGLITEGADLPESDLAQFIFEAGFSTAESVTQAAGRGVGMDVVHSEVKQLGGSLGVESEQGRGARFTIRLPFTLAITQALMVTLGEELYAIPLPTIEGIVRAPRDQIERYMQGSEESITYGSETYNIQHLGALLGSPMHIPEDEDTIPVIMVRAGEHNTALVTEGMRGSREIVVKSVGPQISNIRGISGATILGDGRILIILDVGALARAGSIVKAVVRAQDEAEAQPKDERRFVLVVDDSITVRRVTQRLLERHGMRVMTAKDGVDALAVLQDHVPDVMLLDIEMPRMDGYELAGHMRSDSRFKDVPIIMITSRVGEKHRKRAMELGVNEYLGKPYQESQLLETIGSLLD